MIPEQIKQRLENRTELRPRADRSIAPGDIRRVESGGESRLILVLTVNTARENAQVTLVHPYQEQATGADILVDRSVSDVTYPIVVEAGMRGVIWLKDLGRLVASLPAEVVAACLSPRMPALTGDGLSTGTAFGGPLDARAAFKDAERRSLARLCADSTAAALDGGTFEFEVDEVFHALLAPSPDAELMMVAIVDLWATRGSDLVFTLEHVEFLDSKGLLAIDRWEAALGTEGLAFRLGPLQTFIELAMARFGCDEPNAQSTLGERDLVAAGRRK